MIEKGVRRHLTKSVNLIIRCKKKNCGFEITWQECESIEFAENHFWGYNEVHNKDMVCIHDYEFEVVNQ